ncbi:ATP-binding protein [Streptomyces sp. DSM 40712]|uniref:ATP-binding protein n=2 Tax=Streptomyces lancefieldiae TaxID=3075520 RepID=A0ABU3AP14_9ACTN|nr:ATP-binding protein [Streptomyces sp. DSM 40712]MDT0611935.1 ATP-binding protein [Streptomyces sp. DSM 40712]
MEPTDGTTTAATGVAPPGAPGAVTSAATARAYAESVARAQWGGTGRRVREEDVVDLLLVVSELVTNAIRHGDGLAGLEVRTTPEGMWIAVHDHSAVVPREAYAFPTRHRGSGYGWPLVARLARDIAVDRRPGGGKTISVLVPLRGAGAP